METDRAKASPQAALRPDALIALAISVLTPFKGIFGPYFAVSIVILILAVVFDAAKLVFTVLRVAATKRPEGTGFADAVYYEIGRGEETKGIFAFGIALSVLGVALVFFSQKPAEGLSIGATLSQNPMGAVGGFFLGLGLALAYWGLKGIFKKIFLGSIYYEEPEVKKMKSEMMTAFKQGRTMDAINLFKMDIKSLTDQFTEANALKFDFNREEKELAGITAVFKQAEKYCKGGAMKEADTELNSAKKKYDALRPKIANKLRAYGKVKEALSNLKRLSKGIDESLRECRKNSLECAQEEESYKKLDMNRAMLASESFWRDDNFKEALGELERLRTEYEKIGGSLSGKISSYNGLLARKFPCLKCGKNMNMANTACPSCGASPSEQILELMSETVGKLEEAAKKIEDAKWLMNFEEEESGLEDIQMALASITKQVERGELDRATGLLSSTRASQEALVSEMKEKLELYNKLSGKIAELKRRGVGIKSAIEQGKKDGLDMRPEEAAYARASEGAQPDMIEGLCKSGAFGDAGTRLEKAIAEQEKATLMLSKKADRYKALATRMAEVEKLHKATLEMVEQAKGRKVDVSLEERDLRAIGIEALSKKAKALTPETEKEIWDTSETIAKVKGSVGKKLELFSRLEGMAAALEEKMKELRALVSKGVALKLDIKEEHEKFYTIKMDRIREMLKSGEDIISLKKELDTALDTAQWCIASLSDKLSSVEGSGKWSEAIKTAMKDTEMVDLDSLRAVPKDWRSWAAERYIESNPEDAFAIYNGNLIRTMSAEKKRRYEEILGEMLATGKIRGCAICDDRGVVVASAFPEIKDPMPLGAPSVGAFEAARALLKAGVCGKAGQVVFGGEEFKGLLGELGRGLYLLCSLKPKENIAFTTIAISGGIKKLQEAGA